MGLFDKLRNELIDIIEWVDDSKHTLVWRFPRYQNEIKNGAQLIVRPGQQAIFVHRGQIADIFEPGHYELKTDNLPVLSTIAGWKYGFNSPFRAEVYFVSTKQLTDLKWGTPNPVMMRDPEFGPIRIRAFGTYAVKAVNPKALLTELVGTDAEFGAEAVTELLRSIIASTLSEILASSNVAALDLATKYTEFAGTLKKAVQEKIDDEYGLELPQMIIVNISLPEAVEKAMDTRTSIGVIGDMNKYQQYQMGNAMTADNAAGSGVGTGLGLGMGVAMAGRVLGPGMMGGIAPGMGAAPGMAPPAPPAMWHVAVNGQTQGPYGADQVAAAIAAGQINQSTLVWTAGMTNWSAAGQVPQLAVAFGPPAPPPVPAP